MGDVERIGPASSADLLARTGTAIRSGFAARSARASSGTDFAVLSDHGLEGGADRRRGATAAAPFSPCPSTIKRRYLVPGGAGQRGYTPFAVETAKGEAARRPQGILARRPGPTMCGRARSRAFARRDAVALSRAGGARHPHDARHRRRSGRVGRALRGGGHRRRQHPAPAALSAGAFDGPAIRAGAHEDINAITLLLGAEEAGLEILDRGRPLAGGEPAARRRGGQHRGHAVRA